MNGLNLILLLIIGVMLTDAYASHCQQIVKSPEVDFKLVFERAPWYATYSITKEFVTEKNTPPDIDCILIVGGRVLTNKIELNVHNDNNGSEIDAHFEFWHNQTGVYEALKKSEVEIVNDELILEGREKRIPEKDISIGGKRSLILTDYVNYFATVTCSSEGHWVIWINTPTPFATAEQLNLARNKLAEHGICVQIFPSKCDELAMKELLK